MKQIIALNSLGGGQLSPTITAHYHKVAWSDLSPASQLPHIAIMEIIPLNSTPPQCEPCIIGYTRGRDGKIQNYHMKNEANTIHQSTGSGGNTSQYVLEPILTADTSTLAEDKDNSTPPHE